MAREGHRGRAGDDSVSPLRVFRIYPALALGVLATLLLAACSGGGDSSIPISTPTTASSSGILASTTGSALFVFHGGSNKVTVIDTATNKVLGAESVQGVREWGWVDDSNFFDKQHIWVGNMDPDTKKAEVVLLNIETLAVAESIPVGVEANNIFVSRPSRKGQIFVSLLSYGVVVVIDSFTNKAINRIPVNKIACDVDIANTYDGKERVFVPNRDADTVQAIDPKTLEVLTTSPQLEGTSPWMLTASPDGHTVWVQDQKSGTNTILDATTLEPLKRIPTGDTPSMSVFTPDGTEVYAGHLLDSVVVVIDAKTFEELGRIQIGPNPVFISFRPDGKYAYVSVRRENSIAVIDTATRKVVQRISVAENPFGLFMLDISTEGCPICKD